MGVRTDNTGRISSGIFPQRTVDPDLIEAGRRLFAREARFIAGASEPLALPPEGLPEIAFAGRSNVGKSSLVNALTGRRMLARTSITPGRTRQINFFDLGGRLILVDLPLMCMLDDSGVSYQVVLTKTDKASAEELGRVLEEITAELAIHVAAHPEIHLTSAVDRRGIAELHETLGEFAVGVEKFR